MAMAMASPGNRFAHRPLEARWVPSDDARLTPRVCRLACGQRAEAPRSLPGVQWTVHL